MPFFRRRSTAAPTVGAPVAAPVATPITTPPSFGIGLPSAPAPAPGTPNLSDAITQLKGGNRQSAEAMMRQIVGLPPLPASPSAPVYGGPAVLEPQPDINRPITNMPVPGPNVAAPYPQAPFGNPAQSQMGMRQYLEQQNLMAQRMNQQRNPLAGPNPYRQQTVGPGLTPQGNLFNPMQQAPAIPLGMQVQQPSYMQSPEFQGYQTQMQDLQRQMEAYMNNAPMRQQIDALQGKMQQYHQQYQQQQQGQQPYMPQHMTMDMPQTNQPMMELPTQPPMQQPASPAANMMSSAGFGPQVSAAFGSNMQPQNPVQPMSQFQQNNAQQMSNFQNQSQPAQNTQQNRGGMFGRRFGGGSFGGGGGGGGGGLF